MLNYLNSRSVVSKEELARALDTNERNIIEYRKELESAGYHINSIHGKYGGYYLDKSFMFPSIKLTEKEKIALLQASEILKKDSGFIYEKEYHEAIGKVLSNTKNDDSDVNRFIFERFPLLMSKEEMQERYDIFNEAILKKRKIFMVYNATNNKRREVTFLPYTLFNSNQGWYAIGFIQNKYGLSQNPYFYKLNRVIKIKILNEKFSPIKTFNIKKYIDSNGMNYGETYRIKVILSKPQNVLVQERRFGDNQKITVLDSAHTLLECDMTNIDNVLSFLLYFGHTAKLLEPSDLVDRLLLEEKKMVSNNNNKKTIFFDFNGTIIDDVELCLNILNEMLESCGHQKVSYEKYKEIFGFPVKDYYVKAGFDFSKESFEDLSGVFIKKYQKPSLNCNLQDGVVDVIKKLISEEYNVVLLTASEINNVIEQLKSFKIYDLFNDVLGTGDIYAKSKVEIGVNYINNFNIDPKNAVMIGDTTHDKEVADKMGIDCILYSKGHQSRQRLEEVCDKVIDNMSDIFKFI